MNWENSEVYDEIKEEVWKVINGNFEPNLYRFNFSDGLRSDIMLIRVEGDNSFGISAIQVWKLVETYQVNEYGSLSKR